MQKLSALGTIAISALLFVVVGAISRFKFRTIETRWQIVIFALIALGVEMLVWLIGTSRASLLRGVLNAAVAAFAIISVKYRLEPNARTYAKTVVRQVAKKIVEASRDRR